MHWFVHLPREMEGGEMRFFLKHTGETGSDTQNDRLESGLAPKGKCAWMALLACGRFFSGQRTL